MRRTNKTPRQGVCTTYVGHRRLPVLPKESRHKSLPGQILEAPAKLVGLASLHAPNGNSARRWEKERHEEISLSRNWSVSLFFRSAYILFVIHRDKLQSHAGSAVLKFIKIRCFIQMYTKVLGVLHHLLARGLLTFYDPFFLITVSQPENLFFPGVIFLKPGAILWRHQIKSCIPPGQRCSGL